LWSKESVLRLESFDYFVSKHHHICSITVTFDSFWNRKKCWEQKIFKTCNSVISYLVGCTKMFLHPLRYALSQTSFEKQSYSLFLKKLIKIVLIFFPKMFRLGRLYVKREEFFDIIVEIFRQR
jgi:hypothetical protein